MEPLVLIDSNVFIGYFHEIKDPVREILRKVDLENVVCCGVVKAEVLRGVKSLKARSRVEDFFSITQMVGTSAHLWDQVWKVAWQLDRKGRVLPLQDIVIACCALQAGAAVMSHDKHFDHIPGLRVIRP